MYFVEDDNECPECKNKDFETLRQWKNPLVESVLHGLHKCGECLNNWISAKEHDEG